MKKIIKASAIIFTTISCSLLQAAESIDRHEITWYFDSDYETGRFVNGDPWVKEKENGGGVTITRIDPGTAAGSAGDVNGTAINPMARSFAWQGWDARAEQYSPARNVAKELPLNVSSGNSVVSSISLSPDDPNQLRPVLKDASVLTVLPASANPSPTTFRPPYCGTNKELNWDANAIRWDKLPSLAPPAGTSIPSLSSCFQNTERVWLLNTTDTYARNLHPHSNMPAYGRDLSNVLEEALLRLLLNDELAERKALAINLIQIGIDVYGAVSNGTVYYANGGHNQGMKMPLLFAGHLLDDPNIMEWGDAALHNVFQEDQQTFYVSQRDIDDCPKNEKYGRRRDCYTAEMLGMAEWGSSHFHDRTTDGSNWGVIYRNVSGQATNGHCLVAILMGLREEWNWPPFFDYYQSRYVPIESAKSSPAMGTFELAMWKKHVLDSTPTPPTGPDNLIINNSSSN